MTMPHERTRAVIWTRELLEELMRRKDVPKDIRETAIRCARHYPSDLDVQSVGYTLMPDGQANPFGTSPDYDEHVRNLGERKPA